MLSCTDRCLVFFDLLLFQLIVSVRFVNNIYIVVQLVDNTFTRLMDINFIGICEIFIIWINQQAPCTLYICNIFIKRLLFKLWFVTSIHRVFTSSWLLDRCIALHWMVTSVSTYIVFETYLGFPSPWHRNTLIHLVPLFIFGWVTVISHINYWQLTQYCLCP